MRAAIEGSGGNIKLIADAVGCSRGTVYRYLKRYPELQRAYDAEDASVEGRPTYPREKFEKAMEGSLGIVATIAKRVGCNRGTVDNALKRWPELVVMQTSERMMLFDLAVSKLVKMLENEENRDHGRAVFLTLETLGKKLGFTKGFEVTGEDGTALFQLAPDVVILMQQNNISLDSVVQQYEGLIRMQFAR